MSGCFRAPAQGRHDLACPAVGEVRRVEFMGPLLLLFLLFRTYSVLFCFLLLLLLLRARCSVYVFASLHFFFFNFYFVSRFAYITPSFWVHLGCSFPAIVLPLLSLAPLHGAHEFVQPHSRAVHSFYSAASH